MFRSRSQLPSRQISQNIFIYVQFIAIPLLHETLPFRQKHNFKLYPYAKPDNFELFVI